MKAPAYDVAIIGGGLYGVCIALFLKRYFKRIVVLEKTSTLFTEASFINQARVHNGYHYPRSIVTASRSHVNYQKFIRDFPGCIHGTFTKLYAISSHNSQTTASQFISFCRRVDIPLHPASPAYRALFNPRMIEQVFEVEESVFDAKKLVAILAGRLKHNAITVRFRQEVIGINQDGKLLEISMGTGNRVRATHVFNCSYAGINKILRQSGMPELPFKYEYTEVALIDVPHALRHIGVTVMDGPFFSILPFPARKCYSFTHVRYTPHDTFFDTSSLTSHSAPTSNFLYMKNDAQRYMPSLGAISHKTSLYAAKTLLMENEIDDGRPILFRKDYALKNHHVVMGGKIDNIYDIYAVLSRLFF